MNSSYFQYTMPAMTMTIDHLRSHPGHKRAVLSLYRDLLRKSHRLRKVDPSSSTTLSILSSKDLSIIAMELQVGAYESFRQLYYSTYCITKALLKGIQLSDLLENVLVGKKVNDLRDWIKEYHSDIWAWQKRRAEYLKNEKEIELEKIRQVRGKGASMMNSRIRKRYPFPDTTNMSANEVVKVKQEYASRYTEEFLRIVINRLQCDGKLPNPHLLPYTPETLLADGDAYDSRHVIRGTKPEVIDQAYDREYLETIIMPSLEFEMNDMILNKLNYVVNEKGPPHAVVSEVSSGRSKTPYIRTPLAHQVGRKHLAWLIKEQILRHRLKLIWGASPGPLTSENLQKDGSFPVKGSGGFSDEEYIKPKYFYQSLGEQEEMYELFLECEKQYNNEMDTTTRYTESKLQLDLAQFDWTSILNEVTHILNADCSKITKESNMDMRALHDKVQKECYKVYDDYANRYKNILNDVKQLAIFKHCELVTPKVEPTSQEESLVQPFTKFSLEDRVGRGVTLGDVLKKNGHSYFTWGHQVKKRSRQLSEELSRRY